MDSGDIWVAGISFVAALIGAVVGARATTKAERETRDSDRRKRCTDRVVDRTKDDRACHLARTNQDTSGLQTLFDLILDDEPAYNL